MHINHHTRIVLFASLACFVFASAALGWFLFEINTSGKELTQKVALIAQKNATVQQHTELSELIEATKEERALLEQFVLTEEQTSAFLTEIENLGEAHGVSLKTKSLEVISQKGIFDHLALEFSIEGQEAGVKQVLSMLEALPYHGQITSLTYAREDTGEVIAALGMFITLSNHE